jgi:hypothetical protein
MFSTNILKGHDVVVGDKYKKLAKKSPLDGFYS